MKAISTSEKHKPGKPANSMENIWKSLFLGSLKIWLFKTTTEPVLTYGVEAWTLRSFGPQGALYYVFLASDPWKRHASTPCWRCVLTDRKCAHAKPRFKRKGQVRFCFDCAKWSHYFIHRGASWRPGQNFIMFQWTKNERFSKNGNIIIVQKTKMGP